jgi:hypothetical protein
MTIESARRLALLTRLVEKAPAAVGRTALMKFVYFLSAVRKVPLNYSFSLYSYGPFDSDVLEDIDYAARLGALHVDVEYNPLGYGYLIRPDAQADTVKAFDANFVQEHEADIDWVINLFGRFNASELELASTIVYVKNEADAGGDEVVINRVHQIKPHFSVARVSEKLNDLRALGLAV